MTEANVVKQPPSFLLWVAQHLEQRTASASLELYQRAQEAYPSDFWANQSLGLALTKAKRPREAIPYFTAALALRPHNAGVYVNRGIAFKRSGDIDAAIADYRKALALAADYGAAQHNLALALNEKMRREPTSAPRRTPLIDPVAEAHYRLGEALRDKKDHDGAIASYNRTIALAPKFIEAYLRIGDALRDKRDYKGAVAAYRRAVDAFPDAVEAYDALAMGLRLDGDLAGAIVAYRKTIELEPNYHDAYLGLSGTLSQAGDHDGAIATIRKLHDLGGAAYWNLGYAYLRKGEMDKAIGAFEEDMRRKPKDSLITGELRLAYLFTGQWDKARTAVEQACKRNPDGSTHWIFAAQLHLVTGDSKAYRQVCDQILKRFGSTKNAVIARDMAWICLLSPESGDRKRVQALVDLAVRIPSKDTRLPMLAGLAHYRFGRHAAAIECLQTLTPSKTWHFLSVEKFAVLAMAHHRLGDAAQARASLAEARAVIENTIKPAKYSTGGVLSHWPDYELLLREAEILIQGKSELMDRPSKVGS